MQHMSNVKQQLKALIQNVKEKLGELPMSSFAQKQKANNLKNSLRESMFNFLK